jgi:hypothetical protein
VVSDRLLWLRRNDRVRLQRAGTEGGEIVMWPPWFFIAEDGPAVIYGPYEPTGCLWFVPCLGFDGEPTFWAYWGLGKWEEMGCT